MPAGSTVTVAGEGDAPKIKVDVTIQTRVWQLARAVASKLNETAGNVTIVAADRGVDPMARVVALDGIPLYYRCLTRRADDDAPLITEQRTPRLVAVQKPQPRLRVLVGAEGFDKARVTVNPNDPVSVLRKVAPGGDARSTLSVRGRPIIDETRSFTDLGIAETTDLTFTQGPAVATPAPTRTTASAAAIASSFEHDESTMPRDASGATRARRRFEHTIRILFEDPDDDGYTYELDVHGSRHVGALLQFVEAEPNYVIQCDGRHVATQDSFLIATEGYDGSLFTFVPTGTVTSPPREGEREPLSHLTRPFSPPANHARTPVSHSGKSPGTSRVASP